MAPFKLSDPEDRAREVSGLVARGMTRDQAALAVDLADGLPGDLDDVELTTDEERLLEAIMREHGLDRAAARNEVIRARARRDG